MLNVYFIFFWLPQEPKEALCLSVILLQLQEKHYKSLHLKVIEVGA